MQIIKKLCDNWSERGEWKPDRVVIHISAGSITSMDSWFHTPNSQASSHYGISKTGEIYQYVLEEKKAWTQGNVKNPSAKVVYERLGVNPNLYCISIENEGQDLQYAPETQLQALYELIKDITTRWKIPIDRNHILGHWEIDSANRPYCPSPNHLFLDKIVAKLTMDEIVNVPIKKSQLERVLSFIKSLV